MKKTENRESRESKSIARTSPLKRRLMFAASAGIIAFAMPSAGVYGTRAFAQALPDECEDTNPNDPNNGSAGNGRANAEETIECVQTDPDQTIDPISTTARDLTLIIGDGLTPTATSLDAPATTTPAVNMNSTGDQTFTVKAQATINGVVPTTADQNPESLRITTRDGSISITNEGTIQTVAADGTVDKTGRAIFAKIDAGQSEGQVEDLTITSTEGDIFGGVRVVNRGVGKVDLNLGNVESKNSELAPVKEAAVFAFGGDETTEIKVEANNLTSEDSRGIWIQNRGTGRSYVKTTGLVQAANSAIDVEHEVDNQNITIKTYGEIKSTSVPGSGEDVNAGISVLNFGDGVVADITVAENIESEDVGIRFANSSKGNNPLGAANVYLNLTESSVISGDRVGVRIETNGTPSDPLSQTKGNVTVQGTSGSILGGDTGLISRTLGGDIDVKDMTSITGETGDGVYARSQGGKITVQNIDEITSEDGWAVNADTRLYANDSDAKVEQTLVGENTYSDGGGDISIQKIAIPKIITTSESIDPGTGEITEVETISYSANGIVAFSGEGNINIGADETLEDSEIGNIYAEGVGLVATTDSGSIDVSIAGNVTSRNNSAIVLRGSTAGAKTLTLKTTGNLVSGVSGVVALQEGSGAVDIDVTGQIDADSHGVDATSDGGAIKIKTGGKIATRNGAGIRAVGTENASAITITANGAIEKGLGYSEGQYGIVTTHDGTGKITINANGAISSASNAIRATRSGSGDIEITTGASGTVNSSSEDAIRATTINGGNISVTTNAKVETLGTDGIDIANQGAGNVTATINALAKGVDNGLEITNTVSGTTNVYLGTNGVIDGGRKGAEIYSSHAGAILVQGSSGTIEGDRSGLDARTEGGNITIENLTAVSGGGVSDVFTDPTDGRGISALSGGGNITIRNIGTVTREDGAGIFARSTGDTGNDGKISIQNVAVQQTENTGYRAFVGSAAAIYANSGSGTIDIGADSSLENSEIGNLYSREYGIQAISDGGAISIATSGTIDAGTTGISARLEGGGKATITTGGAITAAIYGIYVGQESDGDIEITSNGSITSDENRGIRARAKAGGNINVTANAAITALQGEGADPEDLNRRDGIRATSAGTGDIAVNVDALVKASNNAVEITNEVSGTTELVLGTNGVLDGGTSGADIRSYHDGGTIGVRGSSGSISGDGFGLKLKTNNGDITVENLTSITGETGDGVYARSQGGKITVQNIDEITSEDGWAVNADTRLYANDSDAEVEQTFVGENTYSDGGGDISIQNIKIPKIITTTEVTDPGTGEVTEVETISYSANGIVAFSGEGNINIGAEDPQNGTGIKDIYAEGFGIRADSHAGNIDINTVGNITSGDDAIRAETYAGIGAISITTHGAIVSDDHHGIDTFQWNGGDITIKTYGAIDVGDEGVQAITYDPGNITIIVNEDITADGNGVRAKVRVVDTESPPVGVNSVIDVTLNANVTSEDKAVELDHASEGSVTLSLGDASIFRSTSNDGIDIDTLDGTAPIAIQGGEETDVFGYDTGIKLRANSSEISVKKLRTVYSETETGIDAKSQSGKVDVRDISNVVAGGDGSVVINIDTRTETVTEIPAENEGEDPTETTTYDGGADVSIQNIAIKDFDSDPDDDTNSLIRSYDGIRVKSGTGSINIGAEDGLEKNRIGDIQTKGNGIGASSDGGDIDISLKGSLDAGGIGIYARSRGGEINILNAPIIRTPGNAIDLDSREMDGAGGANISVQNVSVLEYDDPTDDTDDLTRSASGINAYSGTGSINLGAEGDLEANRIGDIFTTGTAIKAVSDGGDIDIAVSGKVEAGGEGIYARQRGTGSTTIKTGAVTANDVAITILNDAENQTVSLETNGEILQNAGDPYAFSGAIFAVNTADGAEIKATVNGNVTGYLAGIVIDSDNSYQDDPLLRANNTNVELVLSENVTVSGGVLGVGISGQSTSPETARTVLVQGTSSSNIIGQFTGLGVSAYVYSNIAITDLGLIAALLPVSDSEYGPIALSAYARGGDILISNVENAFAPGGIAAGAKTFGGDISIQNIAIVDFNPDTENETAPLLRSQEGIVAESGGGNINLGALDDLEINRLRDIQVKGTAITAESSGGDIDISLSGKIEAGVDGIYARSQGGAVSVLNAPSIAAGGDGINIDTRNEIPVDPPADAPDGEAGDPAREFAGGGADVSIQNTSASAMSASEDAEDASAPNGIVVYSGTGNIDIGAEDPQNGTGIKDITADGYGIRAETDAGTIDIYAIGAITSGNDAILAESTGGNGAINITTRGNIVSDDQEGIQAVREERGDITIKSYGTLNAGDDGVSARVRDSGDITLVINEDVTAQDRGLRARTEIEEPENQSPDATNVTHISINAIVTSETDDALEIDHEGKGQILLYMGYESLLDGQVGAGANIVSTFDGTSISIQGSESSAILGREIGATLTTENGDISANGLTYIFSGEEAAFYGRSTGGKIDVRDIGNLFSLGNWAINVDTRNYLSNAESANGANTYNGGGGEISIQNVAIKEFDLDPDDDTDTPYRGQDGIIAYSGVGDINLGAEDGLEANRLGDILVQGTAIRAETVGGDIDISLSGKVEAGADGIYARSQGGAVSVLNAPSIAAGGDGINIDTRNELPVDPPSDTTYGEASDPVREFAGGGANISISNVSVERTSRLTDVTDPETGAVTQEETFVSSQNGIVAQSGDGNITIVGRADEAQTDAGKIYAINRGIDAVTTGGDITISDFEKVVASEFGIMATGIRAESAGGNITITDIEDVFGSHRAISAIASAGTREIEGADATYFETLGSGNISIQNVSIGSVAPPPGADDRFGNALYGIFAATGTGDINIGALNEDGSSALGDITVRGRAIDANVANSGSIKIRADGKIDASTGIVAFAGHRSNPPPEVNEIQLHDEASNIDIELNNSVSAEFRAVRITNRTTGTSTLRLGTNGNLEGRQDGGIRAQTGAGGLTVTGTGTNAITGWYGASAVSDGGDIRFENLDTISASANRFSTDPVDALYLRSQGGEITLRDINSISSTYGWAVSADTQDFISNDGRNITEDGIRFSYGIFGGGGADISIQNIAIPEFDSDPDDNSNPLSRSAEGIRAYSGIGSINLGAEDGLDENRIGDILVQGTAIKTVTEGGDTEIAMQGNISAGEAGIVVENTGATGEIDLLVQDVRAVTGNAITVASQSAETTQVTIEGGVAVEGVDSRAVSLTTQAGAVVTIAETGAIETGGLSFSGYNGAVTDDVLNLYGYVSGEVLLNEGDDLVRATGSSFERIEGGDGNDTIEIFGTSAFELSSSGSEGDELLGFETLNMNGSDFALTGTHTGWTQANFNSGLTVLDGSLSAGAARIGMDAVLNARDGAEFFGNLFNDGTLIIGSSPGTFTIDGNFEQTATGVLPIELYDDAIDEVQITGTATLDGEVQIAAFLASISVDNSAYVFLRAEQGVIGTFATLFEEIPDLDVAILTSENDVSAQFVAIGDGGIFGVGKGPDDDMPPGGEDDDMPPGGEDDDMPPGGEDDDMPPGGEDDDMPPGGEDDDMPPGGEDDDMPPGGEDDDMPPGGEDDDMPPGGEDDDMPPGGEDDDMPPGGEDDDMPPGGEDDDMPPGGEDDDMPPGGEDDDMPPGGEDDDDDPKPEPEPEPALVSPKEIVPSGLMAAMNASELFTDALMHRSVEDDVDGEGFTFFGTGMGGRTRVGNGDGVSGWNGGTGGFLLGGSGEVETGGYEVQLGAAAGQSTSDLDSGPSHGKIDNIHVGVFATSEIEALTLSAAASYTWHDFDFERVIVSGNQVLVADATTDGSSWTVQGEAFYDLLWQGEGYGYSSLTFGPLVTVDHTAGSIDGFKETNAAILNLTYESETAHQSVLGAGLMAGVKGLDYGSVRIDTTLRLVAETLDGDLAVNMDAAIAAVDGANFSPRSAKLDAQRLGFGLHTKVQLSDQVFGYVRYDTKRGKNLIENEGWAGLTFTF